MLSLWFISILVLRRRNGFCMTNKKKIFIICVILILFFTTIFLKEYKTPWYLKREGIHYCNNCFSIHFIENNYKKKNLKDTICIFRSIWTMFPIQTEHKFRRELNTITVKQNTLSNQDDCPYYLTYYKSLYILD